MVRALLLLALVALTSACATIERAALPAPTLLAPVWTAVATETTIEVDHAPWDAFLATYVAPDSQGVNRVDYAGVTAADRAKLVGYIQSLEAIDPARLTRDQQLAYWINLYNAATVRIILHAFPVASIRDITDGALSIGPWDRPVAIIGGRTVTLNDIEHRIIRPIYEEPRIHYALNCAATGCPNLRLEAWRATGLAEALDDAERRYVNDPRGLTIDASGRLTASKIFIWFQEDFGPDDTAVLARLRAVAAPKLREALDGRTRIDAYAYDWSLNAQ